MITSSAMIESGGKVNLPKAVATQSECPRHHSHLDPEDKKFLSIRRKVTEESLENALQEALMTNADKTVILRGDKDVLFGETVKVMSIIKRAGATEIAIAAEADTKSPLAIALA